jgi:peptidoglycan/xylan/chitin deacetylase (PgdA/CDA1 family)
VTSARDLIGYGRTPPHPRWPKQARLALQFVLNHEEGAENSVLYGDQASETFLSEIIGAQAFPMRHMSMESLFEYGSRAGLWRVLRAFEKRKLPLTIFAAARALKQHAEAAAAIVSWDTRSRAMVCDGSVINSRTRRRSALIWRKRSRS